MHASWSPDAVHACIAWLDHAREVLNPQCLLQHSIRLQEMQAFMQTAPPPPPALQELWSMQVWALRGEPYEVYLLRCLSHQSGVTFLSPHYAVDPIHAGTHRSTAQPDARPSLVLETCMIVGLRVDPAAQSLVQTGWDVQRCPHCSSSSTQADAVLHALPLHYGGDTCDRCGRALPLLPAWTRVLYLVLQRSDRTRTPAVAYGDAVVRHLTLGGCVQALLYASQTQEQQSMLVVHSAQPCPPLAALLAEPPRSTPVSDFHTFYDGVLAAQAEQRWSGRRRSLDEVAAAVVPRVLGQLRVKAAVLLAVLHTLYCAQRFTTTTTTTARRPLHLLLLGHARTGKSALLGGVEELMGLQADVLDATVVRGHRKGDGHRAADSGVSFLAALPARHRDVVLAGPCLTATTLIIDPLPSAAAVAPLQEVLERQQCSVAGAGEVDGIPVCLPAPVHVMAAAGEESASAALLAPFFALTTAVASANSLGESALISQEVVAASRARSSSSRSASRSVSGSLSRSASSSPSSSQQQRDGSPRRRGVAELDAPADLGCLTSDDVQHLLRRTADPPLLDAVMSDAVCHASYMPLLIASAALVEEAQPPPCSALPPPAACRGPHQQQHSRLQEVQLSQSLSASPLPFDSHLRALRQLSRARLMLETAEDVRSVGWTAEMRDEVWRVYELHLVTLADLLRGQSGAGRGGEVPRLEGVPPHGAGGLSGRGPVAGVAAVWPPTANSNGGRAAPAKLSKKRARLFLLEELRRCQLHSSGAEGCVPPADAQQIYAQMGGGPAFGDSMDAVMAQLQNEGLVLRRPGGWRAL